MKMWKEGHGLDAWLTFASWHYTQKDATDLIEIPDGDNVSRSTMAAVTSSCKDKAAAARFMAFLKSEKAHDVFRKWGWR
jgi:accessory colonization factor AcfC